MRADWVDANPEGGAGHPDGDDGGAAVVRQDGEQAGDGRDHRPRQWFNVPVPDIIGRIKGDINYGRGRSAKGTNLLMKFWGRAATPPIPGRASTPGSSPRTSAGASSSRRSTSRRWSTRSTASDLWLRGGQDAGRRQPADPGRPRAAWRSFFDGKVFDPRRSHGLPQVAVDQARRSLSPASSASNPIEENARMTASAVNTDRIATVAEPPRQRARVPLRRRRRWSPSRSRTGSPARLPALLQEARATVIPPLVVLALLLIVWEIAAAGPKATLPTPTKIWQDAKDLIVDPVLRDCGGRRTSGSAGACSPACSAWPSASASPPSSASRSAPSSDKVRMGDARPRPDLPGAAHRAAARLAAASRSPPSATARRRRSS